MSERRKQSFNISQTFGFETENPKAVVQGFDQPAPFVPKIDDNYIFRKEMFRVFLGWLYSDTHDGLYLFGPPGSGKSSFPRQVAARLNIPVRAQTVHGSTDAVDLWGMYMPQSDRSMRYEFSPLTLAALHGHWAIINEADTMQPAVATALNGLLDGEPFEVVDPDRPNEKRLIEVHPDFKLFVTGNSSGQGDTTGFYQGVKIQNSAFMDRFWYYKVDYPPSSEEVPLVMKWLADLPEQVAKEYATKFVAVANDIRALYNGTSERRKDPFDYTMTLRVLKRWVTGFILFRNGAKSGQNPIDFALKHAFTERMSPADAEAVHEIVHLHFADLPLQGQAAS